MKESTDSRLTTGSGGRWSWAAMQGWEGCREHRRMSRCVEEDAHSTSQNMDKHLKLETSVPKSKFSYFINLLNLE